MSSQVHKKTLKQLHKIEFLVASVRTWKPTVDAQLDAAGFSDGASGPVPGAPDWSRLQDWCVTELEGAADRLRRADRAHRDLRVLGDQARLDRDRQRGALEAGQRALRRTFSGTYGRAALPLVGLDAEPARGLAAVREQMREIVGRMRDGEIAGVLPAPRAGQQPVALEPLAGYWDVEVTALEERVTGLRELRKQAEEAMVARDRALKESRRVYANTGRMLEGLYRFAGLDALADRIRLTERAARGKGEADKARPPAAVSGPAARADEAAVRLARSPS